MPDLLNHNTPIESYLINGRLIWVKREDQACPSPGPPFSKVRGLIPMLLRIKSEGIQTVGYVETSVSMAGWGVAWACSLLDMKAVIFDPQYKITPPILQYHRKQWAKFNPEIFPIQAGMAKVNWNICRKIMNEKYPQSKLLPLGLVSYETIEAVMVEATLPKTADFMSRVNTIVVNVGSGTVTAGLVKAFPNKHIIGVMGRSGDKTKKKNAILSKAGKLEGGLFKSNLELHDPGWKYSEPCLISAPFPTHPYYDAKAFKWLIDNLDSLKDPILFWNIGRVK